MGSRHMTKSLCPHFLSPFGLFLEKKKSRWGIEKPNLIGFVAGKWCGITNPTMLRQIYNNFASNAVVYFLPDVDEHDLIPSSDLVQLVLRAWFKWWRG